MYGTYRHRCRPRHLTLSDPSTYFASSHHRHHNHDWNDRLDLAHDYPRGQLYLYLDHDCGFLDPLSVRRGDRHHLDRSLRRRSGIDGRRTSHNRDRDRRPVNDFYTNDERQRERGRRKGEIIVRGRESNDAFVKEEGEEGELVMKMPDSCHC